MTLTNSSSRSCKEDLSVKNRTWNAVNSSESIRPGDDHKCCAGFDWTLSQREQSYDLQSSFSSDSDDPQSRPSLLPISKSYSAQLDDIHEQWKSQSSETRASASMALETSHDTRSHQESNGRWNGEDGYQSHLGRSPVSSRRCPLEHHWSDVKDIAIEES